MPDFGGASTAMNIEPDKASAVGMVMASSACSETSPALLRRGLPSPSSSKEANGAAASELFPEMLLQKNGTTKSDCANNNGADGPLISSSTVKKTVEEIKRRSFGGKEGKPFVRERAFPATTIDDPHESENPTLRPTNPAEDNSQDGVASDDEMKDSDGGTGSEGEEEEDSDPGSAASEVEEDEEGRGEEEDVDDGSDDGDVENEAMEVVASDIGETEDELKVNAAGRQASSDEEASDGGGGFNDGGDDSDDDSDDDDEDVKERPWSRSRDSNNNLLTFVSGKSAASTLGSHVKRPTPTAVSGGDSRDNSPLNVDHSRSNDQDMSDDDGNSSSSSSSTSSGGRGLDVDLDDSSDDDAAAPPDSDKDSVAAALPEEDEESLSVGDSDGLNVNGQESSDEEEEDEEDDDGGDDDDSAAKEENGMDEEDAIIDDDDKLSSSIEVELERALDKEEGGGEEEGLSSSASASSGGGGKGKRLLGSLASMEELEDIINESPTKEGGAESDVESDVEFSDAEPSNNAKLSPRANGDFSDEEVVAGLLSDAFEFDYWSNDTVSAVVKILSTAKITEHDIKCSQYPIRLPSSEDASFWIDKMLVAVSPQSPALRTLADSPELRCYASRKIHKMFYTELKALDISHVNLDLCSSSKHPDPSWRPRKGRHLFVSSFTAAESRLALAALRIKHVIQISGHPLDELWVGDGVKYSTHILPGCAATEGADDKVCDIIAKAASEVTSDLGDETVTGEGTSVLVACSTGDEHSCAVGALFLMQAFGIEKEFAIEWMVKVRQTSNIEPSWIESSMTESSSLGNVAQITSPLSTSKRLLSSQMLSALLRGPSSCESPKRQKVRFAPPELQHAKKGAEAMATATLPDLPLFSLGEAAQATLIMRDPDKEVASTDEDDEEVEYERRLGEELSDRPNDQDESEPVPLLTPPASPLVIHGEEGDATVCEWPSNLAVDSAMTSAITLARPLSPDSLQRNEEEEEKRLAESPTREVQGPLSTGLTPKLQGISVSFL